MYYVNGRAFTSKVKALIYSEVTKCEVNFDYYDKVYSTYNWKVEPPHSLDFYYKEQAQRIRDSYDYLILAYSGGYDSTNILETFYYNNIKLDKIISVGAFSQDSSSQVDENHNGEIYKNVFPYIEKLGLTSIFEKVDYTEYFNNPKFTILQHGNEWIHEVGGWFSPHNWFWRDIERYVVPSNMSDRRVGIIFGKDKPQLYESKGKLGFRFKDMPATSYGNVTSKNNCDRINFYWDSYFPQILIKQLHTLKKFKNYGIHDSVDNIVYNLKEPLLYKSPKSSSPFLSLRDEYLRNAKDSVIYDIHSDGVNYIKKNLSDRVRKVVYSKFYEI